MAMTDVADEGKKGMSRFKGAEGAAPQACSAG